MLSIDKFRSCKVQLDCCVSVVVHAASFCDGIRLGLH